MKWLLVIFGFFVVPLPAVAMNWEGHDDWMAEIPQGAELEAARPQADPLPDRHCLTKQAGNPYEQVTLPAHGCNPPALPPSAPLTRP